MNSACESSNSKNGLYFSCKAYSGEKHGGYRVNSPTLVANQWTTVTLSFAGNLVDDKGDPFNLETIDSLNIVAPEGNFDEMITGKISFRNFKAGRDAYVPPSPVLPTIVRPADLVLFENAGPQTVRLTGITAGKGNTASPAIAVTSSNSSLTGTIAKTAIGADSSATLSFTPAGTGRAKVTVTVSASGADADQTTFFYVDVFPSFPTTYTAVAVDFATTAQTITGLGFSSLPGQFADMFINDLGGSAVKHHPTANIEGKNDNSDPLVTDMTMFSLASLEIDKYKAMQAAGLEHIVFNPLSPPAWMKESFALVGRGYGSSDYNNTLTKLSLHYYDEYAEYLVAVLTAYRNAGVRITGISMQNEPAFEVPYSTCVYNPEALANLIAVVGPRLEQAGFGHVKIFGPNQVFTQSGYSMDAYMTAIKSNSLANLYTDAFSTHGYTPDGVGSASPMAQQWADFYASAQSGGVPKEMWYTEGGSFPNSWSGAMTNAIGKYQGLKFGKTSVWIHWTMVGDLNSTHAVVSEAGEKSSRYYVTKNFYKYIRPGAVQVNTTSSNDSVLVVAFQNDPKHGGDFTMVVVNTSSKAVALHANIAGGTLPSDDYQVYRTDVATNFMQFADVPQSGYVLIPAGSVTTLVSRGQRHTLTVSNGRGTGIYGQGAAVEIEADMPPPGMKFHAWTGNTASLNNPSASVAIATVCDADISLTAIYTPLEPHTLTVLNADGSGSFSAGTPVQLEARAAHPDSAFLGWRCPVSLLSDETSAVPVLIMPDSNLVVKPLYRPLNAAKYTLTLTGGTIDNSGGLTSGQYYASSPVSITANAPSAGKQFDSWTGDIQHLDDPQAATAQVLMPAANVSLTATYSDVLYSVTFTVSASGNAIAAAQVTFDGETLTTDAQGKAVFTDVSPASGLTWEVTHPAFVSVQGTLDVAENDVVRNVALTPNTIISVSGGSLKAYPNPASESLYLRFEPGDYESVRIIDLAGGIWMQKPILVADESLELTVDALPAGIYVLVAQGADYHARLRFVKL